MSTQTKVPERTIVIVAALIDDGLTEEPRVIFAPTLFPGEKIPEIGEFLPGMADACVAAIEEISFEEEEGESLVRILKILCTFNDYITCLGETYVEAREHALDRIREHAH